MTATATLTPPPSPAFKCALWSGIVRVVANILMIAAVFLAMYQTSQQPGSALLSFSLWFFGITIPLWIGATLLLRFIRRRFPDDNATFIALPGHRPAMVRWRVRETEPSPLFATQNVSTP